MEEVKAAKEKEESQMSGITKLEMARKVKGNKYFKKEGYAHDERCLRKMQEAD